VTEAQDMNSPAWTKKARLIAALIAGLAIGLYSGINLLLPLAITAGLWWLGKKKLPPEKLPFLPAIAVQAGHLIWLTFGLLYMRSLGLNMIDIVVLVAGLTWLVLRPGLGPVILLTVFQVLALAVNGYTFAEATVGSGQHKALLVHIIWRVMAVFFMWQAYLQTRKTAPAKTVATGF
jgi:hypothetical protein